MVGGADLWEEQALSFIELSVGIVKHECCAPHVFECLCLSEFPEMAHESQNGFLKVALSLGTLTHGSLMASDHSVLFSGEVEQI